MFQFSVNKRHVTNTDRQTDRQFHWCNVYDDNVSMDQGWPWSCVEVNLTTKYGQKTTLHLYFRFQWPLTICSASYSCPRHISTNIWSYYGYWISSKLQHWADRWTDRRLRCNTITQPSQRGSHNNNQLFRRVVETYVVWVKQNVQSSRHRGTARPRSWGTRQNF